MPLTDAVSQTEHADRHALCVCVCVSAHYVRSKCVRQQYAYRKSSGAPVGLFTSRTVKQKEEVFGTKQETSYFFPYILCSKHLSLL